MNKNDDTAYLLNKIWLNMLRGNATMPDDAGQESNNYYLAKIAQTLRAYGGMFGAGAFGSVPNPMPVPLRIGTDTNYTEFEADGTMRAEGTASCWRDELQSLIGNRLESPASDIVQNNAEGSVTFETGATLVDYVTMNVQLNHDWELGTNIHMHLHWWQVSSDMPNWLIQYRWQIQGDTKTTSWTSVKWASNAFTYSAGTFNQITEFTPIVPPEGYGQVSDIVQVRLIRDTGNTSTLFAGADPESSNVDAVNFDGHIEVDTLGSRQEYVK